MMAGSRCSFVLLALALPCASAFADPSRWETDIAAFERADASRPPPRGAILFIGSSSIRLWESLAEDFPDHPVINRGFGGSQIEDSIAFLDRIVVPYHPRKIIMYAGANDIDAGKSPRQVLGDFREFVRRVHEELPGVDIAFISIAGNPARWAQIEQVRAANELVRAFAEGTEHVEYIDVFHSMLGPDGLPRPDIFISDRLHMNARGYAIWREIVARHLEPETTAKSGP